MTYCVVCRTTAGGPRPRRRTMSFYLNAETADRAVLAAARENPEFVVLGVEPGDLQTSVGDNLHAA